MFPRLADGQPSQILEIEGSRARTNKTRTHAKIMSINLKIAKCSLQKLEKLHFYVKIFAYVRKK